MNFLKKYFSGYNKMGGIKELLILALPMVISSAADGIMTFTDRLFLSKLGAEHMNAAFAGGIALLVIMFFFIGLISYSTALVAQYFGANEKHNSVKAAVQAIIITLLAWPIIVMAKPVAEWYFEFTKTPIEQLEFQKQYYTILAWGSIFSMLRTTLGCFFIGVGKTRVVMTATIVAMVVNIIADYVLIFGKFGFPQMGIEGAALATILGSISAVIILVFSLITKKIREEFPIFKSLRFDLVIMKKLLFYGYPAGVEMFLNFLAFSLMISLFHSQGLAAATASTIVFNWDLVTFIPLIGMEIAVTSLVGRYMGAGKPHVAHRAAFSAIKTGVLFSALVLILFVTIPEVLVNVFKPDVESEIFANAFPTAVSMLRIAALYVLAEAIMVAIVGALRGAGDTHFTMIASVTAHWIFVPVLYLSFNVFHFSVIISWVFLVIFFLVFCGVLVIRFRSGKWKKLRIIKS
ncbi:MAG: MATE family efflux transporter [Bacteroidales bacterium]|nr:MATE family efflux transporter [Bacteroidales bacterium]